MTSSVLLFTTAGHGTCGARGAEVTRFTERRQRNERVEEPIVERAKRRTVAVLKGYAPRPICFSLFPHYKIPTRRSDSAGNNSSSR